MVFSGRATLFSATGASHGAGESFLARTLASNSVAVRDFLFKECGCFDTSLSPNCCGLGEECDVIRCDDACDTVACLEEVGVDWNVQGGGVLRLE